MEDLSTWRVKASGTDPNSNAYSHKLDLWRGFCPLIDLGVEMTTGLIDQIE